MTIERRADQLTEKQSEAWAWANSGQRARRNNPKNAAVLMEYAKDLYRQDTRERLSSVLQKLDAQNELLDAVEVIREKGQEVLIFDPFAPYLGDAGDEVEFPGELSGSLKGSGE